MKSNEAIESALTIGLIARDLLQVLGANNKSFVLLVLKEVIKRLLEFAKKVEGYEG